MFKSWYRKLVRAETALGSLFLLLVRLYWGWLFFVVGLGKLLDAEMVSFFFAELNIPYPLFMTYLVGIVECLGGISLFLGLGARIMSIPLAIVLITAFITAHPLAIGDVVANPTLFTTQEPFLFLFATLTVLCFGAGIFSLDYWWIEKG